MLEEAGVFASSLVGRCRMMMKSKTKLGRKKTGSRRAMAAKKKKINGLKLP